MKKFLFIFLLLSLMTLTCSANMDFSFSNNGAAMSGNMSRNGDYIYMRYKMDGLNSPSAMSEVSPEQQALVAGMSGAEVDMVMSCSNKTMKVRSLIITDLNGNTMQTPMGDSWMPITKAEDIKKLNDLCGKL